MVWSSLSVLWDSVKVLYYYKGLEGLDVFPLLFKYDPALHLELFHGSKLNGLAMLKTNSP